MREQEGVAARVLENIGIRLDVVRAEVEALLGEGQGRVSQGRVSGPED
jgi:ribosomal protein S28E/S33